MKIINSIICCMPFILYSCTESKKKTVKQVEESHYEIRLEEQQDLIRNTIQNDSVSSIDEDFINQQILKGRYRVDLLKYVEENCLADRFDKEDYIQNFEGFQNIGDIDNDNADDFVFVLNNLTYCEKGQSYYFSNPNIERIYTESNCCHPKNIFSMGDIDEDGRNEIGQWYSSCVSRYKRINVWTLKNNKWIGIGEFTFTLNDEYEVYEDSDKLFKKKSKGVFQFLEISDVKLNGELEMEWKTIDMN